MESRLDEGLIAHISRKQLGFFRRALLSWYNKHGRDFPWRKDSATTYKMIVAELLLQRTRAETVAAFFHGFVREFPSWKKLSMVTESRLADFIRPIGLWKRRAASVTALAKSMAARNGRFPRSRSEIDRLPGIGQYIGNAVQLFCHDQLQPLLDVNMARVLERVFGPREMVDIRYDPYLQTLSTVVVRCNTPREINWAILDLASLVCLSRNPRCETCPVRSICASARGQE